MAEQKGRTKMGEDKAGGAARGSTDVIPPGNLWALLRRCYKSVPAPCTALRRELRKALAAAPKCVTPNGRVDGHMVYVYKGKCAFCGGAHE